MHTRTYPMIAATLFAAACGDDSEPAASPPDVRLEWRDPAHDLALDYLVQPPEAPDCFFGELHLDVGRGFGVTVEVMRVTRHGREDDELAFAEEGDGFVIDDPRAAAGDELIVDVITTEALLFDAPRTSRSRIAVTVPERASAHLALDAVRTPDGTTWTATALNGLVGRTTAGGVVQYRGVPTASPWDPEFSGPQSDLILNLAPVEDDGAPALWVASAVTGLSRFTYGDALDRGDDVWEHGQPLFADGPEGALAPELAQTIMAMQATPEGVWAATLNGLYFVSNELEWSRIADGAALSLTLDGAGNVWVGLSRQIDPSALDNPGHWPQAPGALLILDPAGTPEDPSDDDRHWALADVPAVSALAATGAAILAGTPAGLWRALLVDDARALADRLLLAPVPLAALSGLAVVDLEATNDGAVWLAARDECNSELGQLLRLTFDAQGTLAARSIGLDGAERDVTRIRQLDDDLFLSTLVAGIIDAPMTSSGCVPPDPASRTADSYTRPLDPSSASPLRRYGAD